MAVTLTPGPHVLREQRVCVALPIAYLSVPMLIDKSSHTACATRVTRTCHTHTCSDAALEQASTSH